MKKITLDLEQLKKERAEHEEAIKRIDLIIKHYFDEETAEQKEHQMPPYGRMRQALYICEKYLKEGHIVHTINEFMIQVEKEGIRLTRGGLGLALQKPYSNIEYDSLSRIWKLKNRK